MPFEKIKFIFGEILKGVETIHSKNIVHGDLKLGNVMVDSSGMSVKIIDFGISKYLPEGHTTKSILIGETPRIIPPEYYLYIDQSGKQQCLVSKKFDIYSVGIMLYEASTRKRAWEKIMIRQNMKIQDILNQKIDFFSANESTGKKELDELLKRSLHYDYQKRPTAIEFAAELNKIK